MATQLHILSPCHEKWANMTPLRYDCRHCAACNQAIVDFTMKTDAEILDHLRGNSGKTCGKFRPDQLGRPLLAPRTVKRGGFTVIAASFATLLMAQQPAGNHTLESVDTIQPPNANRVFLQQVETAIKDSGRKISGKVKDEKGEELIGAAIKLSLGTNFIRGTVTDYNGDFRIVVSLNDIKQTSDDPLYITVNSTGYETVTITLSSAVISGDIAIPITMTPGPEEPVIYKVPLISQDQVMGQVLMADQIQNLPTRSRNTIVADKVGADSIDLIDQPLPKPSFKSRIGNLIRKSLH